MESKINQNRVIHTKLGDIEYSSIGKGVPIVIIHGGHSNCNETLCHKGFEPEKFQLITPSRPGYGRTPLGNNRTPKQTADLIMELVKSLSIDQVMVYGISAGGLTAIELASNYPEIVSKLILASAISKKWLDTNEKTYKAAKVMFNPRMEKFVWAMVKLFSGLFPTMISNSFYPQFSTHPKHSLKGTDVKELIAAMKNYRSKSGFMNDIDQNIEDDTISKIICPTLIIHSENDNSVSIEHAIHANEKIKNSEILKLKNEWGHLFWIGNDSSKAIKKTLDFITNSSNIAQLRL